MSISKEDLQAAISAGSLSEAQANDLMSLSKRRELAQENRAALDEPFELFRGLNEIFIVVGLGILFAGYIGISEALSWRQTGEYTYERELIAGASMIFALIGLGLVYALTRYFSFKRKMIAPSIALALGAAYFGVRLGLAFDMAIGFEFLLLPIIAGIVSALYFYWARIPFTLVLVCGSVLASLYAITAEATGREPDFEDFFLLSQGGIFPLITLLVGLGGLYIAMRFDLADRYRVSRKSNNAFWLHVAAAPLLVNPVAASLFETQSAIGYLFLLIFVSLLAIFAVTVDRRSFLLSAISYLLALIFTVLDGGYYVVILLLGLLLITVGAKWETIRNRVMNRLPDFPQKQNLPPWVNKDGELT